MKILIEYILIADAELMIRLLETQLIKGLFGGNAPHLIVFNSINDLVISHTTLYCIVSLSSINTLTVSYDKVKPWDVIGWKAKNIVLR